MISIFLFWSLKFLLNIMLKNDLLSLDYDPLVFLRCHSKSDKDCADVRTQVNEHSSFLIGLFTHSLLIAIPYFRFGKLLSTQIKLIQSPPAAEIKFALLISVFLKSSTDTQPRTSKLSWLKILKESESV